MATNNNKPALTLRDGALKATIWRHVKEDSVRYSVTLARTYQDQGEQFGETNSFSGSELLKIARLAQKAYDAVGELKQKDRL